MNLWEYYVKDIRGNYLKNSDKKGEELIKERRNLLILSKLENDNVLLSHPKGEKTNSKDRMIDLEANIKTIIVTFSRKVNNKEEVQAVLRFYRDIYNSKIKQELKRSHLFQILSKITRREMTKIIANNEEDISKQKEAENVEENQKGLFREKSRFSSVLKNRIKRSTLYGVEEHLVNSSMSEEIKSNTIKFKKGNSTKVTFGNLNIPKVHINKYDSSDKKSFDDKFNKTSDIKKNILRSTTHKLNNPLSEKNYENKITYSKDTILQVKISNRKALFTFVIGNIGVNLTVFRNDELDLKMDINSFNIIDHNLTYTLVNKSNDYIMNIEEKELEDFELIKGNDYMKMLFNVSFYEKNLFIHSEKISDTIPKCLSSFLIETLNFFSQKNNNMLSEVLGLFDASLNFDFKFLSDYISNFGLVK
jgi:hypothetical protein